ncbi:MAG: acyl-CoA dehydrogenase [Micavibrio sp.]|nr:acyl-CoA dehydrogenase [Micavibrio sp.]
MILSSEQEMIRDMVREFAQAKVLPGAPDRSKNRTFPKDQIKQMAELGLLGMLVPEAYGGSASGYLSFVLAMEEIAAADGALSTILSVHSSPCTTALVKFGNDDQKQRFLKPMARGDVIGAFALTESGAGSDASAISTRAIKDGNDWVINGSKQFITSGKNGGMTLIFAVTDPKAGKKGISAFLVPTDTKGYNVTKIEEKFGQHASDTCALSFDDMRIANENMLGGEGEGYKIALSNLEGGRLGISAQAIGMARAAYEFALEYAKERTSFGKPLAHHQALQFRLSDMATKIEMARVMLHHVAALRDADMPCTKEACMIKLYASEMAEEVIREAMQVLGGYGYLEEYPLARIYADARVCSIYEGTSDIQRLVIGREILK